MSTLPPLSALRSFETVVRLGSITLAAGELHVTHSAISQQIKLLEQLLGLSLFVREGRGLSLTEDGRLYALQIRHALANIAEACAGARQAGLLDEDLRRLRPTAHGQLFLNDLLQRFLP